MITTMSSGPSGISEGRGMCKVLSPGDSIRKVKVVTIAYSPSEGVRILLSKLYPFTKLQLENPYDPESICDGGF